MKKTLLLILTTVSVTNCALAAVVSTIEQLDDLADFSFAIMSDNKGYSETHYTIDAIVPDGLSEMRMQEWIAANDEFCLGVGDHIFPNRDRFKAVMENNSFFHNHFYPIVGDHDNETKIYDYNGVIGSQANWGRGWVIYKALNNFFVRSNATEYIQFRQPTAPKINSRGTLYDDQLVDYYLQRKEGAFTFHVIAVHIGDSSVLADRTRAWMMNIFNTLAVQKTDHDIVILLTHANGRFFNDVKLSQYVETGYARISDAEINTIMMTADLVTDASSHIFGRHKDFDGQFDGTQALWINTGAVVGTGDTHGYVDFHVFDNPPRFTMQFIDIQRQTARKLQVGPKPQHSSNVTDDQTVPILKYINGTFAPVDWNNFDLGTPSTNNAQFISQSVTNVMDLGQTYPVSITLKNTGLELWTAAAGHQLGSVNPTNNTTWGVSRVALPNTVATNGEVTFSFNVTAPAERGLYNFQWKMTDAVDPNAGWFGQITPNIAVAVGPQEIHLEAETYAINSGFTNQTTTDAGGGQNISSADTGDCLSYNVNVVQAGSYLTTFRVASINSGIQFDLKAGNTTLCSVDAPATGGSQTWVTVTNGVFLPAGSNTLTVLATGSGWNMNWLHFTPGGNAAPQFTSTPELYVEPGTPYDYLVEIVDFEGDDVALNGITVPAWMNFNTNSGVLSGTPPNDQLGSHPVKLRASDTNGFSDQNFTVTVSAVGNDSPVFVSIPVTGVIETNLYRYTLSASDVDGDSLTYSAPVKPSWLTFSAETGVLSGTPAPAHVGTHPVSLTVSDGTVTVTQQFNIAVFATPAPANLVLNGSFEQGGPSPTSWAKAGTAVGSGTTAQDGTNSLCLTTATTTVATTQTIAIQPGTAYNLSVWIHAAGITSSGIGVVFDTGDKYDNPGQGQFVVTANSGWTKYSGSFTATNTSVTLRMFAQKTNYTGTAYFDNIVLASSSASNLAPVVTSVAITNATQDTAYSYTLLAADVENNPLTFTGLNVPAWLSFNTNSGALSGVPTAGDVGSHPVALRVSDGSLSVTQSFSIVVAAVPDVPVSGTLESMTIVFGENTTVTASGGSGTGAYEFRQNGGTGTVGFSGSGASRTITPTRAGTATIEVRRLGDGVYNDTDWASAGTLTVNRADQSITTFYPADETVFLADMTTNLSAAASSGLPVTFSLLSGPAGITQETNLSFSSHGIVVVQALQAGNENWNSAMISHGFIVHGIPVAGSVTIDCPDSQVLKVPNSVLLANSSDPEGSVLRVISVSSASANGGTVELTERGVIYTQPVSNISPDSFSFRIQNEFGGQAVAQADVLVIVTDNGNGPTLNISSVTPAGSDIQVRFIGIPGRSYTVQATTSLVSPVVWDDIGTCEIGSQGFVIFTDVNPPVSRFYRVKKKE